eukprot:843185_1
MALSNAERLYVIWGTVLGSLAVILGCVWYVLRRRRTDNYNRGSSKSPELKSVITEGDDTEIVCLKSEDLASTIANHQNTEESQSMEFGEPYTLPGLTKLESLRGPALKRQYSQRYQLSDMAATGEYEHDL